MWLMASWRGRDAVMSDPNSKSLPLDDVMLAMDVVDTLRHRQDLVVRELGGAARESQLIDKLREIYHQQGIEVPDHVLKEGVEALAKSRFVYTSPKDGTGVMLAKLYVGRGKWGKWMTGAVVALVMAIVGYNFAYLPFQNSQVESARIELQDAMPARMDTLYKTIFDETKVQAAATKAAQIVQRGKVAVNDGDRVGAQAAINDLTDLRDQLLSSYTVRVVNRSGVQTGFWTYPEVNLSATNYYLVVEALTTDGAALTLPILSEESGLTERVALWGLRVPEQVYRAVEADKKDDGIVQRNVMGAKQYGFLEVDYVVPVSGGMVTQW